MLINEKVTQATAILREFDVDCWLTFVRETALNGDPTLPYLVDGDLTVKRIKVKGDKVILAAENPQFKDLEVTGDGQLEVWGVVTNVIHPV